MTKDSEDLAPSNQALNKAASWLGVSDPQKLLDEDPAASAFQARPEGLGLGAKFLPHHKAVHLTAPLEKRFQKRLARDSAGAEQDAGSPMPAKKARNAQQQKGKSMNHEDRDSSDDDDRGRAKAFGPARSTSGSQTSLKQQLLVPGKRKKQQHKQQPPSQQQQAKQQ